jgi:hypothetical protein
LIATDINNSGYIVGYGLHSGVSTAFLLFPIPEPQVYSMLLAGIGLIGVMVRHTKNNRKMG